MTEAAGIVVALQANYLEVELDQSPEQGPSRLLCTRRTRLTPVSYTHLTLPTIHSV